MNKTTVVNIRKDKYDVYIGRGSIFGNPFKMENNSDEERDRVCDLYGEYFWSSNLYQFIKDLRGKKLGCFCKPKRCHGDYLAYLANMSNDELTELIKERVNNK